MSTSSIPHSTKHAILCNKAKKQKKKLAMRIGKKDREPSIFAKNRKHKFILTLVKITKEFVQKAGLFLAHKSKRMLKHQQ